MSNPFNTGPVEMYVGIGPVNDTQSISIIGGVPTSGTFAVQGGPITGMGGVVLQWNSTAIAAQILFAADGGIGVNQVSVSGGPLPSSPLFVTFEGTLAGQIQPSLALKTDSLVPAGTPAFSRVLFGSSSTLQFLGYSETGMRIDIRETFDDIHADLLGPRIPIDVQHFQADALITGDLIRWNEGVLQIIEDRSFMGAGGTGASRGVISRQEVGALMLAQGKTYRFLCDAPNTGLAVFPGMVPYNFPFTYMHDAMQRRRGAKVETVHIIMRALANYTNVNVSAQMPNTQPLYNNDRSGIPTATAPN